MATLIHRKIFDDYLNSNTKMDRMGDLWNLKLSLAIANKHPNDIYDDDPLHFKIILT